jgi:hypothetical protein
MAHPAEGATGPGRPAAARRTGAAHPVRPLPRARPGGRGRLRAIMAELTPSRCDVAAGRVPRHGGGGHTARSARLSLVSRPTATDPRWRTPCP